MANTLDDLYLKYTNNVGKSLEDDRYFQYLYAMVQAGDNTLLQNHQILNKIVDERWISTIEDTLDNINNIIDKPRRFITTSEEVVPVSLAKKITADSVRHLSMNTQFIASTENGNVQPTRILNVTTEESYDLYENRFIYHLIHRLIAFVDKRTDVIFWSTGNETSNTLSMMSTVDDAYEEITYKVSMTIKNTQSLVENDNDNMQVFMRIDRIRRLVFALRNSAFYSIMSGCAKVHSPIQRTNLMMKDPDYRACYKLWQFLESYDEVGYIIEPEESTLEFDEEYMIQMYTNMIANYTVFKSILETDERNLNVLEKKKREPVKPKFIKKIQEEYVDNRDLPDVEIRRVFVDEVTQDQLDAEARLAEEIKLREEVEESEAEAQRQIQGLYQQLGTVMTQQAETEDELEKVEQERDAQKVSYEEQLAEQKHSGEVRIAELSAGYENTISKTKESYEGQLREQQESYETRLADMSRDYENQLREMQEDYEGRLEDTSMGYEGRLRGMQEDYENQLADTHASYTTQLSEQKDRYEGQLTATHETYTTQLSEQKESYEGQLTATHETNTTQLSDQKESYETKLADTNAAYQKQLSEQKESYETKLADTNAAYQKQLSDQKDTYEAKLADTNAAYTKQLSEQKDTYESQLRELRHSSEEHERAAINQLVERYTEQIKKLEAEKEQALRAQTKAENRVETAERAKLRAEEKAEGNKLSRFLIASLSGRGHKKDQEDEDEDK